MENATKALIMAGTLLISMLLISFLVLFLRKGATASAEYYNTKNDEELAKFNAQFEVYDRKNNIFSDIISVVNLANDVNAKGGSIEILVFEDKNKTKKLKLDDIYKEAPKYSDVIKRISDGKIQNKYYFICDEITYNNISGKVNSMTFIIVENM